MEPSRKIVWAGRIVSGLAGLVFAMSAAAKFQAGQMFAHLGLKDSLILPIALLELGSLAIYLIPRTFWCGRVSCT